MGAKFGSEKKADDTIHSADAGEKDRLIAELKNRVAVLENELRLKQDVSSHDIERERAEKALLESEERLCNVFENAASGILIADVNRGYLTVNDKFCEITGYSREQLLTIGCGQIVHPDDQAADIAGVQRLVRGEASSFKHDLRYMHASGKTAWARVNVSLMRVNNQEEPRIVAVVEDITERKLAEDALRKNEKFLNNVFNCIQDGLSVLSKDLSIIRYNPTIEKWHGKDLTGKKCYRQFHGREEPCETCPSLRAIREKTLQREIVRDLIGWKELYAYPLVNDEGEVTGTIEQVRDITELKRAEEERERLLKDAEEQRGRLQAILDALPAGVFIADATGRIVLSNNMVCEIWGEDSSLSNGVEDYVKYKGWWADTGKPIKPEEWGMARAVLKGESSLGEIVDIQRFDGTRGTILNSAAPVKDAAGNIIGGVVIIQDITRRRQMEDELTQAKAQAELYLDLMGHDINNMHQIAIGYLELAQDMMPHVDDSRSEFLDKPVEVLQRSAKLIQNVRKLQKLRDGVFQINDVDVCQVLADVRREFGAAPRKAITLDLNGHGRCHVRANELLHDVFANLVSNAIKHTGDRANINIGLDVVNDNGSSYCRISVEDNGPGIPDDFKDMIFKRMLKGTTKAKGMGLGLYLVKSLMDSYDGRVWVEDRVKGDYTKGAKFVVMLPAVEK